MGSKQTKGGWKEGIFGTGVMNYIANRMPYSNTAVIDNILEVNPKFREFYGAGTERDEAIVRHSISSANPVLGTNDPVGGITIDRHYQQIMYANVEYNKIKRLRDYRVMGAFAEVADALDEICDESINQDDEGTLMKLDIDQDDIDDIQQTEIEKEFKKFVKHYQIEEKGWEYFRQLLVDGELFFEHIIHKDHPDKGILGVLQIPADVVDPIYDNVQNLLIKGFILRKPKLDNKPRPAQMSNENKDNENPTMSSEQTKVELVPLDKNQVTYIHSNIWNETRTLRIPFIENARRAYKQLSLTEDSIVIYRLVRAPERLVFNVDVGNMPPPKAEAYLKKLMQNYWSRKTFDSSQGRTINAFNPQSMLDSFWFAKRAGSDGTSVISLPGGQNLGEITDLLYFVKKLYKSLKVPTNRIDPESSFRDGLDVLREELKFAKFIIRIQQTFANGLKDAFITHLKLREFWSEYKLKDTALSVTFHPPTNFFEMRESQKLELKAANFNNLAANEYISTSYAQKKWLDWSDVQIKANREWMRKDAALMWEISQITAMGPDWKAAMAEQQAGAEGAEGMEPGGGMPMGGGAGGAPPAFGPPPGGGPAGEAEIAPPGGELPASPDLGGAGPPPA
jgi:hypothetical protein